MLPHYKVLTRLGCSKIHGIGVFAITDIEQGTHLFEFDNTDMVWINAEQLANTSDKIKKLYEDFCIPIENNTKYGCPTNFNQLTMAWYMNHADNPNVEPDGDYNFIAKVKIKDGEELTINYNDFNKLQ